MNWTVAFAAAAFSLAAAAAEASVISTLVGGGVGDGQPGLLAPAGSPSAVARDSSNNVYFVDGRRVRRVAAGTGIVTTVAGNGSALYNGDNIAATSAGMAPQGVAIDAAGNLYLADTTNNRLRRVAAATGLITTIAGTGVYGSAGDGAAATAAQVAYPTAVALDAAGHIYLVESGGLRIRRIDGGTGVITTVAGTGGYGDAGDLGPATLATFIQPRYLALDGAGNLFVSDVGTKRVRRIDKVSGTITAFAGNGTSGSTGDGGPATAATLFGPSGLAVAPNGDVYIAEYTRIRRVSAATGFIQAYAGSTATGYLGDGTPIASGVLLNGVRGLDLTAGQLTIADGFNARVRVIAGGVIGTIAGNGYSSYFGDGGPAAAAALSTPQDVIVGNEERIFIADTSNHRIRKYNPYTGVVTTAIGTGTAGFNGDGNFGPAAQLNGPSSIAAGFNRLYIADSSNHRVRVATTLMNIVTDLVSTVAGTGVPGFSGDGGDATLARVNYPSEVRVAPDAAVVFIDTGNQRVRRIDVVNGNVITTIAGNGTNVSGGDGGPATAAGLFNPSGLAIDAAGNIYVGEFSGNRVRRIDAMTGIITTVAGDGQQGFTGDGGPATAARLSAPSGLALDAAGNLYITEFGNNRVRLVTMGSGVITTIAGNGTAGFGPDGVDPILSGIAGPVGVFVTARGDVLIADQDNNRIRKISPPRQAQTIAFNPPSAVPYSATIPILEAPLAAMATSGLPVTFSSLTPSICIAESRTTPATHLNGPGVCTIVASQLGDTTWDPAAFVTRSFQVVAGPVFTLTVSKSGTGIGTVVAATGRIACGAICTDDFASTPVTLTATPSNGSTFAGWSGACSGQGTCTVTMNTSLTVTAQFTASAAAVRADFDGNRTSDLLWRNADGRQAIWLMNGLAAMQTREIIGPATGWTVSQMADLDGDGKADLVWQHTDGRIALYLMNGVTPISTQQIVNAGGGWSVTHTPDLDGDGKADLIFQNANGTIAAWLMNGTAMTAGTTLLGAGSGWSVIRTGDFDGDGKADLVWQHTDGRVAIWLMEGLTVKSTQQILNAGTGWTVTHTADFNGDGKSDLVWQNVDGSIAIWLMNGTTMTSGLGLQGAGTGWSVTHTGDFNGDGKADLFFLHTDGRAAIYLMNGLLPTQTTQILNAGGGWSAKRVQDMNGDGKADIVWENVDGRVAVWLMNGTAMTSGSEIIGPATGWSVSGVSP